MKILEDRQTRTFFTGIEVEHTIAYGARTLFITGTPELDIILDEITRLRDEKNFAVEHLYFGTSQSFKDIDFSAFKKFDELISYFLANTSYWITLDFDVQTIDLVTSVKWCESNRFIPMISVKIPNIKKLNYHSTLKIDDTMWGHSNPGVWTHHLNSLLDKNKYTDWSHYKGDE